MYILKVHDTFTLTRNTTIEIYCPGKTTGVQAVIPKDISFKARSNWESAFGALRENAYFKGVDTVTQFLAGVSINQPFLARKAWKGSEPFTFQIQIAFIAQQNAYNDVMKNVNTLMSMTLPRKLSGGEGINLSSDTALAFTIPGPSPLLGVKIPTNAGTYNNQSGDYVNIRIGSYLTRSFCFIEEVNVKLSSVLDPTGNPQYALCDTTISTMDALFMANNLLQSNSKASGSGIQPFNITQ